MIGFTTHGCLGGLYSLLPSLAACAILCNWEFNFCNLDFKGTTSFVHLTKLIESLEPERRKFWDTLWMVSDSRDIVHPLIYRLDTVLVNDLTHLFKGVLSSKYSNPVRA